MYHLHWGQWGLRPKNVCSQIVYKSLVFFSVEKGRLSIYTDIYKYIAEVFQ